MYVGSASGAAAVFDMRKSSSCLQALFVKGLGGGIHDGPIHRIAAMAGSQGGVEVFTASDDCSVKRWTAGEGSTAHQ